MTLETGQSGTTLVGKLYARINRYKGRAFATFAVAAIITFFIAQVRPELGDLLQQSGVIPYLTLLVVLDIASSMQAKLGSQATKVVRDQDEALPVLDRLAHECRGETVDLLEYAGQTILPLIRTLRREGVSFRMLVMHPDSVAGLQRQRNLTTLDTIYNSIFRGAAEMPQIRCYRAPCGLRGRRFGDRLIELGWLTPDLKRETTHGHDNPSLLARLDQRGTEDLKAFFARTFEELWTSDSTEDATDVFNRLHMGSGTLIRKEPRGAGTATEGPSG